MLRVRITCDSKMSSAPHVLLPYQQRWQRDRSEVRVAEKSRRIGFSWNAACESVLDAAERDGCDVWYVGYNKDMAREFILDCAFWTRKFWRFESQVEDVEEEDGDAKILAFAIRFPSGFRITALSSRPTNLRGKKGHIIIDEAAFHDDLPGLLKSAMAVFVWGGRARVDIISTHNGTDSAFASLCESVRAGKLPYSLHKVTIDDAIAEGLVRRICLVTKTKWSPEYETQWRAEKFALYGDDADEELLCVPARSGGTYIGRDLVERAMVGGAVARLTLPEGFSQWKPELQKAEVETWCKEHLAPLLAKLPKDKIHFFGEDFGRTSDRTVIAPGYVAQDLKRVFPFAVEMSNVPYDQQKQVLFYVVDRLPKFAKGALDATGNGGYLAEKAQQKYGQVRIEAVALSEKWYAENLPPFKAAFEDNRVVLPSDADHMIDLSHFKVINGVPKLPKARTSATGEGPPRHGDAAIAYALAHAASRMPSAAYDYKAAPKPVVGFRSKVGVF